MIRVQVKGYRREGYNREGGEKETGRELVAGYMREGGEKETGWKLVAGYKRKGGEKETGWELAAGYRREGYRIQRYRIVFVVEYKSLAKYRNKMNFLTRVLSRENHYQIFSFFF